MSTAAILAGGRAHRLGGLEKSQLVIDGQTILDRQLRVLQGCAGRVVIVADDRTRFAGFGVPVFEDLAPGKGALGGLYTALSIAAGPVLVVACDMPFLTEPFLIRVMQAAQDVDAAVPRTADGYHPLCACYSQSCAGPIRTRLDAGELKLLDLLTDVHTRTIDQAEIAGFDPDGLLLLNINTPDDLARAHRGRGQRG
jgi:molybdopterin-guanine dinucleotide biosynthesis protein A